ncbi:hypothetical protein HZU75_17200 [Chitinibacter fontanus]|uniref:UrcA family protein n=1 Tax=Chitinibacter fontanus TaxID=1737446 RepID=A0A7D5VC13_9NEIS|nr:hypothetical protein [Chitinibacter fontanus]QLI83116.1 hypothetical protein HZU75_17200 [Chitinibacter fontanus]
MKSSLVVMLGSILLVWQQPANAMCDSQVKTLQAEMNAQQVSLDVRRRVNTALQPLLIPRTDLNPLSNAECQKRVQAARDLMLHPTVQMAAK